MSVRAILRCKNGVSLRNILPKGSGVHRARCLFSTGAQEESEDSDVTSKIIFNSTIPFKYSPESFETRRRQRALEHKSKIDASAIPVSLKYLYGDNDETKEDAEVLEETGPPVVYPYALVRQKVEVEEAVKQSDSIDEDDAFEERLTRTSRKWMNDYERYCGPMEEEETEVWQQDYGTADSVVPISRVPCGGCGALLHCQDQAIPGYLPCEIFKQCRESDLRSLVCQRCHFLNKYNTALSVIVDEECYPRLISQIREERALVVLMVDLTDFPCSLWPNIFDVIGHNKPVVIVGNKIDLLWGDQKGWSQRLVNTLRSLIPSQVNVQAIHLISAKTGFGVEELITSLYNVWSYKGNVYLIGCTNVGKSTLFNVLLQSDYCKVKARDLVQRATISPWPGTTLNLLKFPILRPQGWRMFLRTNRLKSDRAVAAAERALFKEQTAGGKGGKFASLHLIGNVGQTLGPNREDEADRIDSRSRPDLAPPESGIDPKDPDFRLSKWFYDTPGVIHRDQILDLFTAEELMKILPKKLMIPRTFLIKPGWTVFIAGVSRMDYINGTSPSRWTIFSSERLPITVCLTTDAVDVYEKFVGTETMAVPSGDVSRLNDWPQLKHPSNDIKFSGVGLNESCGDVVLSSSGWIAVSLKEGQFGVFRAWTPDARGIHARCPSFLPFAVRQRGNKFARSPIYAKSKPVLQAF